MTWRSSLEGGVTCASREINCNQAPDLCVCNQRPANQLQSTGDRVSRWDEGTGHLNWGLSANLKEEIVGRGTSGQLAKTVMDFKQRNVDTVTFKRCFSSKRMVNMVFVTFVRLCCTVYTSLGVMKSKSTFWLKSWLGLGYDLDGSALTKEQGLYDVNWPVEAMPQCEPIVRVRE